jgi:hypothetical protein
VTVVLTIELSSLAQASVITDALQREIEALTNSLRYHEKQATEPFSQKGLAVEEREAARKRHAAMRERSANSVGEYTTKLKLAKDVWGQVNG